MEKERTLFLVLREWLRGKGFSVYGEVSHLGCLGAYARADLIAIKDNQIYAFETKNNLSLKVVEQAANWIGLVNQSFVAIPKPKQQIPEATERFLRKNGIGLITIDTMKPKNSLVEIAYRDGICNFAYEGSWMTSRRFPKRAVSEWTVDSLVEIAKDRYEYQNYPGSGSVEIDSVWNWATLSDSFDRVMKPNDGINIMIKPISYLIEDEAIADWKAHLDEKMMQTVGGSTAAEADYVTEYKRSVDRVLSYIREHPGCSIREIADYFEKNKQLPNWTSLQSNIYQALSRNQRSLEIKKDPKSGANLYYSISK